MIELLVWYLCRGATWIGCLNPIQTQPNLYHTIDENVRVHIYNSIDILNFKDLKCYILYGATHVVSLAFK